MRNSRIFGKLLDAEAAFTLSAAKGTIDRRLIDDAGKNVKHAGEIGFATKMCVSCFSPKFSRYLYDTLI
jgi:hypothetical protein